jgi:long-chain acyl-CoA synthetase
VVTINPLNIKTFNRSIGLPVPSTNIDIRNDQHQSVAIGECGELWVKGPQVMKGYWQAEGETANVFDEEGWLRTGDIVHCDEQGYLFINDRKKDMIIVSGFNVYPNEVEEVIAAMPEIAEVGVVGIPDQHSGEVVKAFIVRKDVQITEQDVLQHCKKYLTGYKLPKYIEFRESLPKSNIGKILRQKLREGSSS